MYNVCNHQALAKQIYDELEGLINAYGPDNFSSLMPLVVTILENLDSALSDNQVWQHVVLLTYFIYCL